MDAVPAFELPLRRVGKHGRIPPDNSRSTWTKLNIKHTSRLMTRGDGLVRRQPRLSPCSIVGLGFDFCYASPVRTYRNTCTLLCRTRPRFPHEGDVPSTSSLVRGVSTTHVKSY